jgi:uncharacterized membrane protein
MPFIHIDHPLLEKYARELARASRVAGREEALELGERKAQTPASLDHEGATAQPLPGFPYKIDHLPVRAGKLTHPDPPGHAHGEILVPLLPVNQKSQSVNFIIPAAVYKNRHDSSTPPYFAPSALDRRHVKIMALNKTDNKKSRLQDRAAPARKIPLTKLSRVIYWGRGPKMADKEEKRKSVRMPVEYEYFLTYQGRTFSGKSRDVSPFGIGILIDESLPPGNPVRLSLYIKDANLNLQVNGVVRHCMEDPEKSGDSGRFFVGIEFLEEKGEDLAFLNSREPVSRHTPSHTISINASAAKCYELMIDYERYPQWAGGVKKARIQKRYPDGRGRLVEFEYNIFFRKVRYVNDYSYDDENTTLSWVSVGGDSEIVNNLGSYVFAPRGENQTMATFNIDITIALLPSKRIINYFTTVLMRKEMKNFKKFVEKEIRS